TKFDQTLLAINTLVASDGPILSGLDQLPKQIKAKSEGVSEALSDISGRLNRLEVPEKLVIDLSKLVQSIDKLQTAVNSLLEKANDKGWSDAAQAGSQAILRVNSALDGLHKTINSLETLAKNSGD